MLTVSNGAAKMQVHCYLADVEGGVWKKTYPKVGCKDWPLFPTALSLKEELEDRLSFYTGKKLSLYHALCVNGKVEPTGECFTDDWAINDTLARYGIYVKVEDSPGSTGDTGLPACNMVGAGGVDVDTGETMVNVNILDEKFKGWVGKWCSYTMYAGQVSMVCHLAVSMVCTWAWASADVM